MEKGRDSMTTRKDLLRRLFEWCGFIAGTVLAAFGVVAIVLGVTGRATVVDSLQKEKIVGTAGMTPLAAAKEAKSAKLVGVDLPTVSLAGKQIDSGDRARVFASYMRIDTLAATGGLTYAEMGRFVAKRGTPKSELTADGATSNPNYALIDTETQQVVPNHARDIWVTETALTTALNMSYIADRLALFGVMVGVALLLSGIGFIVLAFAALHRKKASAPA